MAQSKSERTDFSDGRGELEERTGQEIRRRRKHASCDWEKKDVGEATCGWKRVRRREEAGGGIGKKKRETGRCTREREDEMKGRR